MPTIRFPTRLLPCQWYIVRSRPMQKHAVHMCRVATVVMETTQVVLSQFKNFIAINGELNKVSVPKIVSECCELVKLCYVILIVAVRFFFTIF